MKQKHYDVELIANLMFYSHLHKIKQTNEKKVSNATRLNPSF